MSNYNDFKEVIKKRAATVDEWDYGVKKCWDEMTAVFSADIDRTIHFLDEECTADEFKWLSEIFDEIAERTKSFAFIDALRRLAVKYPEETKDYNIISFIDVAEGVIRYLIEKDK